MRAQPSDRPLRACLLAGLLAFGGPIVSAAGDAKRGATVFKSECTECHSAAPGRNKKGPSLFGIVGRKSAQIGDFSYSDALKATGWTWDEPTLRSYLSKPSRVANPGTKMKYDGMSDVRDLDDVLAYLQSLQ